MNADLNCLFSIGFNPITSLAFISQREPNHASTRRHLATNGYTFLHFSAKVDRFVNSVV